MKRAKYIIVMVIFTILLIVNLTPLIRYAYESKLQDDYYDDIASLVDLDATAPTKEVVEDMTKGTEDTEPTEEPTLPPILPQYQELYDMNPDIVGWIKFEDTKINYPVMQTPGEPDYYLKRDFNKKTSAYGCIYALALCDVNKPSDNITIFGHNMNNGSMFAGLYKYRQPKYWEEHQYFTFDTIREEHQYQVFAVFKTSEKVHKGFNYHMFIDAEDEEEFDSFVAACKEYAYYDTGITPKYGDKLVCLSTCEYTYHNARLVVAAVRVD